MIFLRVLSALLVMAVTTVVAIASPCGKSGMTALRANDGGGFLFYLFRDGPDIYFALSGKEISFPNGVDGPRRFIIDGIMYESLIVKPKDFMKSEKALSDLEILKEHQRYEFDYILKSPRSLKTVCRVRTTHEGSGQRPTRFHVLSLAGESA